MNTNLSLLKKIFNKFFYFCKKNIKLIFFLPFNIFFLLILLLLFPIIRIKISELETRAIGHFSITVEIFLCEIKKGIYKNELILWFTNDKISNRFLLKKWKEIIFISQSIFLEPLYHFIRFIKLNHFFISHYRDWRNIKKGVIWQANDLYGVLKEIKPNIIFTDKEINKGRNFLKNFDVKFNNNYICFFARSSSYRNEKKNHPKNSSIFPQLAGINNICKTGLMAFRVGSAAYDEKIYSTKYIFDYANSNYQSDFLDIYLLFNCQFMVSTHSGIDAIPILNRKKIIYVNWWDLHLAKHTTNSFIPIVCPKKILDVKRNKLLSFKEAFKLKIYGLQSSEEIQRMGLKVIDNDELEISEAIFEMYNLIILKKKLKNNNLNLKFWDLYAKYYDYKPEGMQVSSFFLRKNYKIIN